jgi:hypothetical protein
MLEQGIIRLINPTFSAPVLLVKVDDSWRFYINYCMLNKHMFKDKFWTGGQRAPWRGLHH